MNTNQAGELRFESRRPFPGVAILWALVAAGMIALAVFDDDRDASRQRGTILVAVLPIALAVASWFARPRRVEGMLAGDSLVMTSPETIIPVSQFLAVTSPERDKRKNDRKRFSINVHHETGLLHIPKNLDVDGDELYSALLQRLPQISNGWTNPLLHDYFHRQTDIFGPDRVFVFNALSGRGKEGNAPRALRRYGAALVAVGLIWAIVGHMVMPGETQRTGFLSMGIVMSIVSALVFVGSFGTRAPVGIKQWEKSSLIVTPVGLALVQGDVKGELTWNQLLDLKYRPRGMGSFQLTRGSDPGLGILLKVEGVTISIVDIYDRPLSLIYGKMVRYWRPQFGDQSYDPIDL